MQKLTTNTKVNTKNKSLTSTQQQKARPNPRPPREWLIEMKFKHLSPAICTKPIQKKPTT